MSAQHGLLTKKEMAAILRIGVEGGCSAARCESASRSVSPASLPAGCFVTIVGRGGRVYFDWACSRLHLCRVGATEQNSKREMCEQKCLLSCDIYAVGCVAVSVVLSREVVVWALRCLNKAKDKGLIDAGRLKSGYNLYEFLVVAARTTNTIIVIIVIMRSTSSVSTLRLSISL